MNKLSNGKKNTSTTKRPGVHSKKKSSNNKNSRNYVKQYRGQGK